MRNSINLKVYLSRYNEYNCPDYLYYAWTILFSDKTYPDQKEILRQAEIDIREEEANRPQKLFNQNRRKIELLVKRKYNW